MGAYIGIAGEPNSTKLHAAGQAMHGIVGRVGSAPPSAARQALVGVAAANTGQLVDAAGRALGGQRGVWSGVADRTQVSGSRAACWLLDYSYLCTPYAPTGNGHAATQQMHWRAGREAVFGRAARAIPLIFDSGSYRIYLTGTAPAWMARMERYIQAILLADPDGYMSQDDPRSLEATLANYAALEAALPGDPRHIPVWSCRWLWTETPGLALNELPGWAGVSLASLVPHNGTQRRFRDSTLERAARLAVANAVLVARHPTFCAWAARHPLIAIGGLVGGPVGRLVRHLYAAVLCALHPSLRLWLLGQASYAVVNGLGTLGLLDRVSSDGSWWIKDGLCHKVAYLRDGLITTVDLGGPGRESFLTTPERMASLLRSLFAAYAGEVAWPTQPELPIDWRDLAQVRAFQTEVQAAQLALAL